MEDSLAKAKSSRNVRKTSVKASFSETLKNIGVSDKPTLNVSFLKTNESEEKNSPKMPSKP